MPARKKTSSPKDSTAHLGFEAKLWLAADKLRNSMDASEPSGARLPARQGCPREQRGEYKKVVPMLKLGVVITHFNQQAAAAMLPPLLPLAEQHQIVAEVEARTTAIEHLEAELDRQITRSSRLRQAILRAAFGGELE